MTEKVIAKNVSLYPEDWELIERETEPMGMNTSQGLRFIIRDWKRLTERIKIAPETNQEGTGGENKKIMAHRVESEVHHVP